MTAHPFLAVLALALAGTSQAASTPTDRAPVVVRFENLAWVNALTALPILQNGRVLVPPTEACDLLALTCTTQGMTLTAAGPSSTEQAVSLTRVGGALMTPLAPLVQLAGQRIGWNPAARVATIYGGAGTGNPNGAGWRSALNEITARTTPGTKIYAGPISVSIGSVRSGVPTVPLTLNTLQPLSELTLISKAANSLTITGSLVPGTVDVPNPFIGCPPGQSCTLPTRRDALWTLAYATLR
ncbi:hypothetical protein [Deinococcus puniceus]|uniref:Copper amine oxidase-like N-terminal domain-containing protein n=1 Tax=Deinococcus puniceus TaxID=1182568 RepID=A0A172T6E4_9DEIO|nr:hypothetical protein [Deinococcus puniceus]ANE42551.1 hypothetical protein SU48_00875 [Deinococcus puniceus]